MIFSSRDFTSDGIQMNLPLQGTDKACQASLYNSLSPFRLSKYANVYLQRQHTGHVLCTRLLANSRLNEDPAKIPRQRGSTSQPNDPQLIAERGPRAGKFKGHPLDGDKSAIPGYAFLPPILPPLILSLSLCFFSLHALRYQGL